MIEMLPRFLVYDTFGVGFAYAISISNLLECETLFSQLTNFVDLNRCQFGIAALFTFGMISAASVLSVYGILELTSKIEMFRIHTCWIVACMQNVSVLWYRTMCHNPERASRVHLRPVQTESSVIKSVTPGIPQPTFMGGFSVYLCPETFVGSMCGSPSAIMPTYKTNWLALGNASSSTCLGGDRSGFSAAAFTQFLGGLFRGMIVHVESFLSRFGQTVGRCIVATVMYYLSDSIIPQMYGAAKVAALKELGYI